MVSKFEKIKQYVFQQVESGLWPENHRVPSENALAQQFSVSRMTARRALQELTEQGVLTRTQGLGTFVACLKSQASVLEIKNIADEIHNRGHQHKCIVQQLQRVEADKEIAIALGVKPSTGVYFSTKVHFENQIPIQVEQRFVNPQIAPDYLQQDFSKITPHEYLSRIAPLTEATHIIEATLPSGAIAQWLNIAETDPCLQVQRRTWSTHGIVSFARLHYPGDRYRLGGHLTF